MATHYLSSVTYDAGGYDSGTLANTQADDTAYYRGKNAPPFVWNLFMNLFISAGWGGNNYKFSVHFTGTMSLQFKINGVIKVQGTTIDFDDVQYDGVNTVELDSSSVSLHYTTIFYFKAVDVVSGYTHKFCGVLPANIGKISGVATASIGKVKGVEK